MTDVSLRARVLLPLALALMALLAIFITVIYQTQNRQIAAAIERQLDSVDTLFEKKLAAEERQIEAIVALLARNQAMQAAFRARNRQQLLQLTAPLLQDLRQKLKITHFYFHNPDRTNFLRVYNPQRYGDRIDRYTLREAAKYHRPAAGLELGKLGTMTLRVVLPWEINGELAGFIEMGKEVDHIIAKTHEVLGVELYVSIYKKYLDRKEWEAGMALLGRVSNWDQLPFSVIVSRTQEQVPAEFADFLMHGRHTYMEMDRKLELRLSGRLYRVGVVPLFDVGDNEIGDIVMLYDVTAMYAASRRTVLLTSVVSSLVGIALFILFSCILGKVQQELTGHRQHLEELVRARTEELTQANEQLRQEIGERQEMQSRLQQTQASLRRAQQLARLGNWQWDVERNRFWWSEESRRIFQREKEEIGNTYKAFLALVHPKDRAMVERELQKALRHQEEVNIDHRIVLPDQDVRFVHLQAEVSCETGGGSRMFGTIQDIDERRRMEQTMQLSRNLESLGVLAGGIAHDFNNLLTAVFCNIELAREQLPRGSDPARLLEMAEKASDRARHLTGQLLTFARGGEPVKRLSSLATLIRDTGNFVLSGTAIRLVEEVDPELWPVEVDQGQINQVLQNLLLNAKEAMEDAGTITLSADNEMVGTESELLLSPGPYVKVVVRDQGKGIAGDIQARIFDPYFSTKEKGARKGTGLGLSICHSIITKHHGHIMVASEPGKGAAFTFYLPARPHDVHRETPVAPVEQEQESAAGTIPVLLMDDEEAVSQVGADILTRMGFTVARVQHGEEAVARYHQARERGRPFGLVILDLTIRGGMGGVKTLRQLLAIDPQVRAVLASGYADDPVMADYRRHGFMAAVAKPFTVEGLRQVVGEVMAQAPHGGGESQSPPLCRPPSPGAATRSMA